MKKQIVHLGVQTLDSLRYHCIRAVYPTEGKWTFRFKGVTCKNCKRHIKVAQRDDGK